MNNTAIATCCPGQCCLCTSCGCCPGCKKGTAKMMVKFDKNIYFPDEQAEAIVQADSSECQLKI